MELTHNSLYDVCFVLCTVRAAVQDIMSANAQPDADKSKKRPVYTTKKKKPAVTQQDTEPVAGYKLLRCVDLQQLTLQWMLLYLCQLISLYQSVM